jgi:membrane protease YdiL (CAAX protease family)
VAGGARSGTGPTRAPAPVAAYLGATAITLGAILGQYVLPQAVPALRPAYGSIVGAFTIVYAIPIAAFALLVGAAPLRAWAGRLGTASVEALRWYGALTLLALLLSIVALAIVLRIDPSAASSLNAPTPILRSAAADPWLWVGLSFLVGAVEETIFRGWIFGYWLARDPSRWRFHVAWTSALFAGVHVYYALTYGIVVVVPALVLFFDGVAFALAYRSSGGNLVAIAALHGWNDATVFIALPLPALGIGLHYAAVLLGALIALLLYLRGRSARGADPPRLAPI